MGNPDNPHEELARYRELACVWGIASLAESRLKKLKRIPSEIVIADWYGSQRTEGLAKRLNRKLTTFDTRVRIVQKGDQVVPLDLGRRDTDPAEEVPTLALFCNVYHGQDGASLATPENLKALQEMGIDDIVVICHKFSGPCGFIHGRPWMRCDSTGVFNKEGRFVMFSPDERAPLYGPHPDTEDMFANKRISIASDMSACVMHERALRQPCHCRLPWWCIPRRSLRFFRLTTPQAASGLSYSLLVQRIWFARSQVERVHQQQPLNWFGLQVSM